MKKNFILLVNLIILANNVFSQSKKIAIDGKFDDWTTNITTYTDTNENKQGLDLLEFQVTNDSEYLYIKIKANKEFDFVNQFPVEHKLGLFIDTDNNSTTGFNIQQYYGSEVGALFYDFKVHYNQDVYSRLSFNDLGIIVAPVYTSNQFEIAIKRDVIPDGKNALFPSKTIKILFRNGANADKIPNTGSYFSYTFDDSSSVAYQKIDLPKKDLNHIRTLAYNTYFSGLNDQTKVAAYKRIIQAVNPDIVGFVESDTSEQYVKSLFDQWLVTEDTNGWYVSNYAGVVIVSRWPILKKWDLNRQFAALIDLPQAYNKDLIFTTSHLICCNSDNRRQEQVDKFAQFVLGLKNKNVVDVNTPIIYAGDLNLVGLSQQLQTLLTGDIQNTNLYGKGDFLDWDNTVLNNVNLLQTELPINQTWKDEKNKYPSGKLDYIIYTDYSLNLEKSYILNTNSLPEYKLKKYNLLANDTKIASDHLPVIADFTISKRALSIKDITFKENLIYPNPVEDIINLDVSVLDTYNIKIFNNLGIEVLNTSKTSSKFSINTKHLQSGIYFVVISNSSNKSKTYKLLKK